LGKRKKQKAMGKIVFGVAATEFQAEAVVNELKVADFPEEDISVLLADKLAALTKPGGPPPGVGGGTLGWLQGIDEVAIPGAGPFIAAGPILSALNASAVGGSNRGIYDALTGMGLSETGARSLERKARAGSILIAVHADTDPQAERARAIFEQAQALDIVSSIEFQRCSSESPNEDRGFGERSSAALD
jgi:hypothetical protein